MHHLDCASMTLPVGRLPGLTLPPMVTHCLLVEGATGLTLVDTGFGTTDCADPAGRLGRAFTWSSGARFDPAETAVAQVTGMGFSPSDVRDIVLTHLDVDHAGGLADFPHASVHVLGEELDAARRRTTVTEKLRYAPAQWRHGPHWVEHVTAGGDTWFGFASVTVVAEDVVLVPLRGHTRGHSAVAVRRPEGGWLLDAGDTYFFHDEKEPSGSCPPALRLFQRLVEQHRDTRLGNLARLRELHAQHSDEVSVFCSHDAAELRALTAEPT